MVTPNLSSVLHKISEIYDRIAFAAVGRYNEYEVLRKAGVTYADVTGYQFDRARRDRARPGELVRADARRDLHRARRKPYEVEIVVAEVGATPDDDQIYRITWDGSVSDEPGFVAFGGQADQVAAALKERFSDGMSLTEALGAALAALAAPAAAGRLGLAARRRGTAPRPELTAANLEVAILDRARAHRTFRRLHGPRLEELLAESRAASAARRRSPRPAADAPAAQAAEATPGLRRAPHRPALGAATAPASPSDEPRPPARPTAGSDGIPPP